MEPEALTLKDRIESVLSREEHLSIRNAMYGLSLEDRFESLWNALPQTVKDWVDNV